MLYGGIVIVRHRGINTRGVEGAWRRRKRPPLLGRRAMLDVRRGCDGIVRVVWYPDWRRAVDSQSLNPLMVKPA